MEAIIRVHFPDIKGKLLQEAMKTFYLLREIDEFKKKPSTSELIDWIRALSAGGVSHDKIAKEVPYVGALLKKETDYDYFVTRMGRKRPGRRGDAYGMLY
jgi:MoxR-like ATPase